MTDLDRTWSTRGLERAVAGPPQREYGRGPVPRGSERARLDLRFRYPIRWLIGGGTLLGAVLTTQLVLLVSGTLHTATYRIAVIKVDDASERKAVQVVDARIQSILSLARSEAFVQEVKVRSGTEVSLADLEGVLTARRPAIGIYVFLEARSKDEALVRELAPHLGPALASLVDKARSGALVVLTDNGRDAFAEQDADYRGPLYLEMFDGRPDIGASTADSTKATFIGAGIGLLAVFGLVVLAQGSARVSSRDPEELDAVMLVPQVGRLPRLSTSKKDTLRLLRGLAMQIDGQCPRGVERLALGGSRVLRERAGATLCLAGALSITLERRVVVIDADTTRHGLTRRCRLVRHRGLRDLVRGDVALRDTVVDVTGPDRGRSLPLRYRWLFRGTGADLAILPIGQEPEDPDDEIPMDALIADVIEQVSRDALVVVALPPLPATHSVQRVMATVDAALLVVLDGWSSLDDAEENAAAMSSLAPGRSGFVLIDN